jgi:hypothetical protein
MGSWVRVPPRSPKKSLKIKHLAKRCRATVPTKSGLGTVWVQIGKAVGPPFVRRRPPVATGQCYVALRRRFAAALDARPRSAQPGAHDRHRTPLRGADDQRHPALSLHHQRHRAVRCVPAMPVPCASVGLTMPPIIERGKPVRCEAITAMPGKAKSQCDQPATVERGGNQVCAKHHRAVWIEYMKPAAL